MADEGVTVSNITPAFFEKYIMSLTLNETYEENGVEPILVLGPTQNWKICYNPTDRSSVVEIRPPYVRRIPNENSMILDMVDSSRKAVLVEFQDGSRVNALKLAPNPDSLVISSSKIINRYNTMTRWVEEHWGDEIDNINFSGSTYSFCATLNNGNPTGLSVANRNFTESYKYLKALVDIYRTNGYLYQEPNGFSMSSSPSTDAETFDYAMVNRYLLQNPQFRNNHPRHGMIRERLYNRISFDYLTLLGYFESFDITEDSVTPFRFIYSAVFKAEKTIWTVNI
jgi:hypothetical protein